MAAPQWAVPLFQRMAVPRLPGSPAVREVRAAIAEHLMSWGYTVREEPFVTSARRLTAVSLSGAGLGWVTLVLTPLLVLPLPGWPVTLVGIGALGLVALLAVGTAEGYLPSGAPQVEAVNLVAEQGSPRLWLVAHADSKGQRFSLAARVAAVVALVVASAGLLVLLVVRAGAPVAWWSVAPVAVLATMGGAVLSASRPLDTSPGAVDNATGVIAALVAAERLRERGDIGILITDAEELGLEGARAWVRELRHAGRFINFDGLDDRGAFRVVRHDRPAAVRSLAVEGVAQECSRILRRRGELVVEKRPPPGVMVDGSALASVGMAGVTLSRGDWRTLAVLHTPGDVVSRVSLTSAVTAGEVAALAAERLLS